MIGVTSFFHDPEAFDAVRDKAVEELCKKKDPKSPLRIWIPGCSTGEEAFSLAMIFQECLAKLKMSIQLQIFGTDLDETAIGIARLGLYPKSIGEDVPLEKYLIVTSFRKTGHTGLDRTPEILSSFCGPQCCKRPSLLQG